MTFACRRATLADLDVVTRLGHEVSLLHATARPDVFATADDPAAHEPRWHRAIATQGHATFIAERAATPIGFITGHLADEPSNFYHPSRICHVGTVGVMAGARGQGIGRALMALLEAWARENSADEVQLIVWCFNERAHALYRELGYEDRAVSMGKRLRAAEPMAAVDAASASGPTAGPGPAGGR